MYRLFVKGEYLTSDDPAVLVDVLERDINYLSMNEEERSICRVNIARHYRILAQVHAISKYPMETIIGLSPYEQNLLFSTSPEVTAWEQLPPLILVKDDDSIPVTSTVINGEETVAWIRTSSDLRLLMSLAECGTIRFDIIN